MSPRVRHAYARCRAIAQQHYENFPVASWLLPRRMRGPIAAIYVFARQADDLADEGLAPDAPAAAREQRRTQLRAMAERIRALDDPERENEPVWIALADAVRRFALPREAFLDLLSAFEQDLDRRRYADFGELMDYCRRSANPVGRLLLHVAGQASARNLAHSDAICSALQLINFYQDLAQDHDENRRIYLPEDEMARFGVNEAMIAQRQNAFPLHQLLRFSIDRADRLLRAGAPLGRELPGRFGLEIRAIVAAGARTAWKLKRRDTPFQRPRLDTRDRLAILRNAVFPGRR